MRIRLLWSSGQIVARLVDSEATKRLLHTLPYKSQAHVWGDEVYFAIPVHMELQSDASDVVDPGSVCYWVAGKSLAIPFGPTPISKGMECRLADRVNLLGQIEGDPQLLRKVQEGELIQVTRVKEPY